MFKKSKGRKTKIRDNPEYESLHTSRERRRIEEQENEDKEEEEAEEEVEDEEDLELVEEVEKGESKKFIKVMKRFDKKGVELELAVMRSIASSPLSSSSSGNQFNQPNADSSCVNLSTVLPGRVTMYAGVVVDRSSKGNYVAGSSDEKTMARGHRIGGIWAAGDAQLKNDKSSETFKKLQHSEHDLLLRQNGVLFLVHNVATTDTLQYLAIKYSTTIADIKRWNQLWREEDLFGKSRVKIPITDYSIVANLLNAEEKQLFQSFIRENSMPSNETNGETCEPMLSDSKNHPQPQDMACLGNSDGLEKVNSCNVVNIDNLLQESERIVLANQEPGSTEALSTGSIFSVYSHAPLLYTTSSYCSGVSLALIAVVFIAVVLPLFFIFVYEKHLT